MQYLQRKGAAYEYESILGNLNSLPGYNTRRGVRLLYEKCIRRSGAARLDRICGRRDGGSIDMEPPDPGDRSVFKPWKVVIRAGSGRVLDRHPVPVTA